MNLTGDNVHNNDTMPDKMIITTEELSKYGPVDSLNDQVYSLVKQQQDSWELAGNNYASLSDVQTKSFNFGHFKIDVQYNPGRMRSSAAKTDSHSISKRPCFLCAQNLPPRQRGIAFHNKYIILTNPFPIFPLHLTIAHRNHVPQKLEHFFPDMLELCKALPGFTVFYNGPFSGASAPDHFHFQAGSKGAMPVETELKQLKKEHAEVIFKINDVEVAAVESYLRRFLAITSSDSNAIIRVFYLIYQTLLSVNDNEPMLNVLSFFEKGEWNVIVFPRGKQRPSHFFKKGINQLIIGPASVEMGGILILPKMENFETINHNIISEIYNEVTVSSEEFNHMLNVFTGCR
jgi:ATP adenylyltransferase/5',5'''-P-1,P-4-tetraphosphate phosphorylase II